ncbi:HAD domain-containing protein [Streptomyces sp. NPDC088785]|uniref:HAD domain-containing protein n=1 Tax=Streptomyces sp. NPDC088785 TaxID=3365897 RepID=UPI003829EF4E
MTDAPLLFLDVDGPLLPFGNPTGHRTYPGPWTPGPAGNPLLPRLDPALGPLLRALPCELVWATTWGAEANDVVAPWLGLGPLAVVEWPDTAGAPHVGGAHWKLPVLARWAAGRPFVWVDDEIGDADRAWAARWADAALLYRVDPARGLRADDVEAVGAWLASPCSSRRPGTPG